MKPRSTPAMPIDDITTHLPITLRPEPARVVIKPFVPAEDPPGYIIKDRPRAQRIADRFWRSTM